MKDLGKVKLTHCVVPGAFIGPICHPYAGSRDVKTFLDSERVNYRWCVWRMFEPGLDLFDCMIPGSIGGSVGSGRVLLYTNIRCENDFYLFWKLELPTWDRRNPVLGLGEGILAYGACHVVGLDVMTSAVDERKKKVGKA